MRIIIRLSYRTIVKHEFVDDLKSSCCDCWNPNCECWIKLDSWGISESNGKVGIWSCRACGIYKLSSLELSSTSMLKITHKSNILTLSGFSSVVKNCLLVGSCHQLRYSDDTYAMWYCDLQSAKDCCFSCIVCQSLRWRDELIASSSASIVVYFEIFRFSLALILSTLKWGNVRGRLTKLLISD